MEKTSEELLWAIKNGELHIVKDVVEKQVIWSVRTEHINFFDYFLFIIEILNRTLMLTMRLHLDIRYIMLLTMDKLTF